MRRGVFEGLFVTALVYTVIVSSSMPARAHESVVYPVRAWEGMKEDTLMDTARKSVLGALRACREELNNEQSDRNDAESYLGEAWCDPAGADDYQGTADEFGEGYEDGAEAEDTGAVESGEAGLTYIGTFLCTAYCPNSCCCGDYATGYTASGTLATEGRTIACNSLPLGTEVCIDGNTYVVEDTGWSPYGEAWIDFFFYDHQTASDFGVQIKDVYVWE